MGSNVVKSNIAMPMMEYDQTYIFDSDLFLFTRNL